MKVGDKLVCKKNFKVDYFSRKFNIVEGDRYEVSMIGGGGEPMFTVNGIGTPFYVNETLSYKKNNNAWGDYFIALKELRKLKLEAISEKWR